MEEKLYPPELFPLLDTTKEAAGIKLLQIERAIKYYEERKIFYGSLKT